MSHALIAEQKYSNQNKNKQYLSVGSFFSVFSTGAAALLILLTTAAGIGLFNPINSNNAYAADSITLSVDKSALAINLFPDNTTGTFSKSSEANISVSTTSDSGYTLRIKGSDNTRTLVGGDVASGNNISSIASGTTEAAFSSNDASDYTVYNNKWGYMPSEYVNYVNDEPISIPNAGSTAVFLPGPTAAGDVLKVTNCANGSSGCSSGADTISIAIGARVNSELAKGTYSNAFVIEAVANFTAEECDPSKFCIHYDSNGLAFSATETQSERAVNNVNYDSETTEEQVTKYGHMSNVGDDGIATGYISTIGTSIDNTQTVTIDGAETLNVTLYYDTRSTSATYGTVTVYQSPFNISSSNDATVSTTTGNISGRKGGYKTSGRTSSYTTWNSATYTVTGDTVKFHFYRSSTGTSYRSYYGYYAIVTATVNGVERTVFSGEYDEPVGDGVKFYGWSSTQVAPEEGTASDAMYASEAEALASIPGGNGDAVTLYAVWSKLYMQDMLDSDCTAVARKVYDNRDETLYTVQRLDDGTCWLLDNLALDLADSTILSTMTSANTNASNTSLGYLRGDTARDPSTDSTGQYATAGVSADWNGTSSYSAPLVNLDSKDIVYTELEDGTADPIADRVAAGNWKVGGYYNFCATSAGSYCYGNGKSQKTGEGNATEDICPAGWRLPTGGTSTGEFPALAYAIYGNYNTHDAVAYTNFRVALHLPLSAYFENGVVRYPGAFGHWWASNGSGSVNYPSLYVSFSGYYTTSNLARYRYYGNTVRCVKKESTIADVTYMQDVTLAVAANTAEGATASLIDSRDGQVYTVAKIMGTLWMTRNLAIGCAGSGSTYSASISSKTLTSADSKVSTNWSTPTALLSTAANSSATSGYTTAAMQCNATYGAYYNYAAVSAGTVIEEDVTTSAYNSNICPKGWTLPSNGSTGDEWIKNHVASISPVYSGAYNSGSLINTGSFGYWWTSGASFEATERYSFYYNSNGVLAVDDETPRYRGYAVRCVVSK